jgi:hypothetical protein
MSLARRFIAAFFVVSSSLALAACGGHSMDMPPVAGSQVFVSTAQTSTAQGFARVDDAPVSSARTIDRTGQRGRRIEPTAVPTAVPTAAPSVAPTVTPVAIVATGPQPASLHPQPPAAGWVSFASDFAKKVAAAPVFDPQSATFVQAMVGSDPTNLGTIQVAHDASGVREDYSAPWYTALPTDAKYTIHCIYSAQWGPCGLEGKTIPIPAYAQPENGFAQLVQDSSHDQHLAIHDPANNKWYDMWIAPLPSGNGGTMTIGYGSEFDDRGNGYGGSATASGFELTQGLVRPVELLAGSIPHALFVVTPCENGHVAPATGDDGGHDAGCPPIGAHVWLDSTQAEIDASGATPYAKMIMLALHTYGGFIGDRTSANHLGVAMENDLTYTQMGWPSQWALVAQKFNFPYYAPGDRGTYHVPIASGSLDLSAHLHVID